MDLSTPLGKFEAPVCKQFSPKYCYYHGVLSRLAPLEPSKLAR